MDLRGGSHLFMALYTSELLKTDNQQLADRLTGELRTARILYNTPVVTADSIKINILDTKQMPDVARMARVLIKQYGGTAPVYEITEEQGILTIQTTALHHRNLTK